ncbi:Down syndrome cell adhesion molecule-like protein Dscam2 [Schistocerca americana]|uniref:Down syndrome cell adhesion molecule-like protein Dscam2 n=1 Tax=Schistocerca americana TaxID=7009 RepID=UPI001F4FF6C8|nr:Down syndrome cell adhesion molecule-like protein Dscam2 [Schistocerca americana]
MHVGRSKTQVAAREAHGFGSGVMGAWVEWRGLTQTDDRLSAGPITAQARTQASLQAGHSSPAPGGVHRPSPAITLLTRSSCRLAIALAPVLTEAGQGSAGAWGCGPSPRSAASDTGRPSAAAGRRHRPRIFHDGHRRAANAPGTLSRLPAPHSHSSTLFHLIADASTLLRRASSNSVLYVSQGYQLQVHNVFCIRGNVAVLTCNIPAQVRGLLTVTSWLKDEPLLGRSALHPGGRYTPTTGGTLHVRDTAPEDTYSRFYCQTVHQLTGERRISMPGQIIVTEPDGNMQPRIEHSAASVVARAGSPADLVCAAQGFPPPTYRWFRETGGALTEVRAQGLVRPLHSVLQFPRVQPEDSARYVCVATNSVGEDRRQITLSVSTPLTAHIRPQQQVVDAGARASFNCSVRGGGGDGSGLHVAWLKDGRPLAEGAGVNVLHGGEVLVIESVGKHDRGMYQCVARSGDESAQGSAELTLGAVAPELQWTFIEQTLQPGPGVSLRCVASGNPPPRVHWLLDGAELSPRAGLVMGSALDAQGDVVAQLNISSARVAHGGLYTCVARNDLGSAQHSATLNVYGPPMARAPRNLTAVAGRDVYLRCPVAGYPIASVSWRRAGEQLPSHVRQRAFPNGTLLLRQVEGASDRGEYSCTATNQQGQSAQGRLHLDVMKPPQIAPFQFPSNLQEGMRAQVSCSIISGDLPITITWRKDGGPLPQEADVHEQQHEFVSNLLFSNLAARHSGHYMCIASNAAAVANYTTRLIVRVAPTWLIEPQDVSVLYQHPVSLHCQANGFPVPTITWMKAKDIPLETGQRMIISSNGSVIIRAADPSHEGHYTCQASNGIGPELRKVVYLRVNVPAHFRTRAMNQSGTAGEATVLTCEAEGDLPLRISWTASHRSLTPSHTQTLERQIPNGIAAELHLEDLSRRDAGPYRCSATNEFGQDEMTIYLTVKEPPESPGRVEVLETNSRWVNVAWGTPYSGHAPISHYIVQFQEEDSSLNVWNNVTVGGSARTARLGGLKPATAYKLRLVAVNEVGPSAPSDPTTAYTLQEAPSGPPIDISVEATMPESLLVRWKPPLQSYANGEILGYHINYRQVSGPGGQGQQLQRTVRGAHRLEVLLTSLEHYTRYEVTVRAFNQVGSGPASPPHFVTTLEGVPDMPPQDLRCSALSPQSIRVRWDPPPPEHRNGIIDSYKVFYKNANDVEVKKTTNLETNLHGLAKFTNYSIRVLALTSAGEGIRSNPIHCTTEEDVPGPPEHIKALAMTSDSIMVAWTKPAEPNGNIVKYNVYISTTQQHGNKETQKETVFGDRELIYEVRRLKEFQRYDFWVTASTTVGEGQPSPKVSQAPISRVPARIASFSRRVVHGAGQSLVLPCRTVGLPAPSRQWRGPSGASITSQVLPDGGLALGPLRPQEAGNYTCVAENVYGKDEINYWVIVQIPPSPPVLSVPASTSRSLSLQWKLFDDGGSPITGYTLNYKRDFGEWQEVSIDPDRKTYNLEGVKCGSNYQLYLTASNSVGTSKPSPVVNAATKGSAPKIPNQEDLLSVNSTSVILFLDSWPSGGCPLQYFVVEYRAKDQKSWTLVSNNIQQEELVIPDLTPATWYAIRATAHNDAGSRQHEFVFATRTKTGEIVHPELVTDTSEKQESFYTHLNIIIPILSGIICTVAASICVCIVVHRRHYAGYKQGDTGFGAKSLAELENQRNSDQQSGGHLQGGQLYSPSPARKGDSSLSGQKGSDTSGGQDYEICPYATFSLPSGPNNTQTMDYSMQFQTFSQQECYSGQPRPSTSGYGSKSTKEYYSRVRAKSAASRNSGEIKLPRSSKSPPDGLSLEISCISSQQTLPVSVAVASSGHRRTKSPPSHVHNSSSAVGFSRSRSCSMGADQDSDSSGGPGSPRRNESKPVQYRIPASNSRTSKVPHHAESTFDLDSSTESTEASPEVSHRSRRGMVARRGAPSRQNTSSSTVCQEVVPLQPPSGFSDGQELSEAECDRETVRENVAGLPLFRHEELEQELSTLVKRYRQERDREKQDYTIHV